VWEALGRKIESQADPGQKHKILSTVITKTKIDALKAVKTHLCISEHL
jgi:poly-gamma-glutamate capsule biosynthesis protein CapA/YwtB (metallophosphatase superfamily)